jgi:hypothetical protein
MVVFIVFNADQASDDVWREKDLADPALEIAVALERIMACSINFSAAHNN